MNSMTVLTTQPNGKIAARLREMDIYIEPVEQEAKGVDRYILSDRVVIERWTSSRFLKGIQEKTLFTRAIELRDQFATTIFILEGEVDYEISGFNPQAVRGAMTALVLVYGITVFSSPDAEETTHLIAMTARQEQVGVPEISLVPKRKASDLADLQRRIIEMLPGSGVAIAKDLLQYFGSVRGVMDASEEKLRKVRGIGPKKAAEIIRVLTAEYEALEAERHLEEAIAFRPGLLFFEEARLLARQHFIFSDQGERHFVDMVFFGQAENSICLVELKLGKLNHEHYNQIRRYLDHAAESDLMSSYMKNGAKIHGILATVEPCKFDPHDEQVSIRIIDKAEVIATLKAIRAL